MDKKEDEIVQIVTVPYGENTEEKWVFFCFLFREICCALGLFFFFVVQLHLYMSRVYGLSAEQILVYLPYFYFIFI